MSIVGGLFRAAGLGTLVDGLEAQGVMKVGMLEGRATPSTIPEMFIGQQGITNLGKAGVPNTDELLKSLETAQKDWLRLPTEDWNKKWADSGFAYDPVANKAMMEISDASVQLKKGVDLEKLPTDTVLGFDEVFNAETLKKAYPNIGDVKIGFENNPYSPRLAGFDPKTDTVYFNRANPQWNPADVKSNMLHEIQHYVQGKELFTQGDGFSQILQKNVDFQDSIAQLDKGVATSEPAIRKFLAQNPRQGFNYDNVSSALTNLLKRDDAPVDKSLAQGFKNKDLAAKFKAKVAAIPELANLLNAKEASSAAYKDSIDKYMRVAGEVFARQTGERADMTAADRLAAPAMRNIETNPTNAGFNITLDNMTAPTGIAPTQAADPFAMQVPQSTIPGI